MIEEIQNFLTESYFIPIYLATWIVAMYRYRRYFDTVMRFFPIFIMYTFLTELLGYFIKYHDEYQFFSEPEYSWHNVIIYNIYSVISFSFFYYIYWTVLKQPKHRDIVKKGAFVSLSGYLISVFFQDPLHSNLYYADLIASIVLILCVWMYFKEKRNEESSYPLYRSLLYWVSLGLVIFHIFFPLIFIAAYEMPEFYFAFHLHQLLLVLIAIMYFLFMVGFLIGQRKAFR